MNKLATLCASAGLALVAASSAHAAMRFTNISDHPIVFTIRCASDSVIDRWTVGAHRTLPLTCNNGAPEALVRIYTRHPWGVSWVSRWVANGYNYEVFFNNYGNADIA